MAHRENGWISSMAALLLEDLSGIESDHVGLATAALALALMFLGSWIFPDRGTPRQVQPETE